MTAGAATYRYFAAAATAEVPPGVVTSTSTRPAACFGDTTVRLVSDATLTDVPATPPNVTRVAPDRPEPVTVTRAPPATGPDIGDAPDTIGATARTGEYSDLSRPWADDPATDTAGRTPAAAGTPAVTHPTNNDTKTTSNRTNPRPATTRLTHTQTPTPRNLNPTPTTQLPPTPKTTVPQTKDIP